MSPKAPNPTLLLRPEKSCPRCGLTKPRADFYASKKASDGLSGYCKGCTKASAKEWDKAHPVEKAARDHRQYESNPERRRKTRERFERWALENPELARENARLRSAEWTKANPERVKENQKRYRSTDVVKKKRREIARLPETKEARNRRKKFERSLLASHEWFTILNRFRFCCAYCGAEGPSTLDHIDPISGGGEHTIGNVVPCCRSCNSSKGARSFSIFAAERGLDEEEIRRKATP